jgi:hypothetical protein
MRTCRSVMPGQPDGRIDRCRCYLASKHKPPHACLCGVHWPWKTRMTPKPEPPTYFVNVNRHTVTANRRAGAWKVGAHANPPIRIAKGRYGRPRYAYEIRLTGLVTMKYDPKNPLPCGASVWLESSGVEVLR